MLHRVGLLVALVVGGAFALPVLGQASRPAERVKLEPEQRTFKGFLTEWAKVCAPKAQIQWEAFGKEGLNPDRELNLYLAQPMPRQIAFTLLVDAASNSYASPACYVHAQADGTATIAPTKFFDKKELRIKKSLAIKDLGVLYEGGESERMLFVMKAARFGRGVRVLPRPTDSLEGHYAEIDVDTLEIEGPQYFVDEFSGVLNLMRGKVKALPALDEESVQYVADAEKRLATPMRFAAGKMPLQAALKKISDTSGVNIVVFTGWKRLGDAKITPEEQVQVSPGLPLNAVQGIVDQLKRKYEMVAAVKNGAIYVGRGGDVLPLTTVVRVYDVRKHTAPNGRPDHELATAFVNGIRKNVSPGTWENSDNRIGQIEEMHGLLIVQHTEETHKRIATLLKGR